MDYNGWNHSIFENLVIVIVRLLSLCVTFSPFNFIFQKGKVNNCKIFERKILEKAYRFSVIKVRSGSEFGSKSGAIFSDTDPTWQKVPNPTRSGFTPLKSYLFIVPQYRIQRVPVFLIFNLFKNVFTILTKHINNFSQGIFTTILSFISLSMGCLSEILTLFSSLSSILVKYLYINKKIEC